MDLRSTIRAVSRLPFTPERLSKVLCDSEPAANNPADEDHSTFWLVVADQFAKRGIISNSVRDKALEIIDRDSDLHMLEELGMSATDLQKRRKVLGELRQRLIAPLINKQRPVLKSPQPFLMDVGDAFIYPTCGGDNINPYFRSKEMHKFHGKDGSVTWQWQQDGWSVAIIVDRGRAFDFLAWYRPLTFTQASTERPLLENLRQELLWKLDSPGTCTKTHLRRMEFEKIGRLPIDSAKLQHAFPDMKPGTYCAVNDISIANRLHVGPALSSRALAAPGETADSRSGQSYRTILGIAQILSD